MQTLSRRVASRFLLAADADLDKMTATAETKANEFEKSAKEIRKAVKDITKIWQDKNRSEKKHGPAWDTAESMLKKHNIHVPNSALLSWNE